MNELNKSQIANIRNIIAQLLPVVSSAEAKFKSAKNWGILDILGGGFIVDMIKHSKINSAGQDMNRINYLLGQLQTELNRTVFPTDYTLNVPGFATFADFVFDGFIADIYMQSKISSSLNQVRELKEKLLLLDREMARMETL